MNVCQYKWVLFNTLRPRQNGRHFPDDIFKWIFLNENVWISINISLKFVPRVPINNILMLVQVMAWCRPGDKPLSEPMMVRLPMHICVTRPQWVKMQCFYLEFHYDFNPPKSTFFLATINLIVISVNQYQWYMLNKWVQFYKNFAKMYEYHYEKVIQQVIQTCSNPK